MTDIEMIRMIKAKDQKGLTLLYESYRPEFMNWIMKFTGCNGEDASEYYQAAVLIMYDNIHNGRLEDLRSSLKTYLFSIGKNLIWDRNRQQGRAEKVKAEYYLQTHMLNMNSERDQLIEESNLTLISRCFDQLGDPCHTLLDLFYYQKKSMDEITAELNYKNTDSAKNQKYKCIERLRKLVDAEKTKLEVE